MSSSQPARSDHPAQPPGSGQPGAPSFFGARFSLYPMADRFVPVILDAIEGLRDGGLEVETDDVSTFLGGAQEQVFGALRQAFTRAAGSGEHVAMAILFSYG